MMVTTIIETTTTTTTSSPTTTNNNNNKKRKMMKERNSNNTITMMRNNNDNNNITNNNNNNIIINSEYYHTHNHNYRMMNHYWKCNKRLRKVTKCGGNIIPWKDQYELQQVGYSIYNMITNYTNTNNSSPADSLSLFDDALEMITVWKARCGDIELPHAIESTAVLARIYIRDIMCINNSSTMTMMSMSLLSKDEIRYSYSSAIIRCINGFADTLQQQNYVAAPISVLANQLGIPTWIVDIRHESSHNALPTLSVLRLAAITLLEYLKNVYWIPTCGRDCFFDSTSSDNNNNQQQQQSNNDLSSSSPPSAPSTTIVAKDDNNNEVSKPQQNQKQQQQQPPKPKPKAAIDYLLQYKLCTSPTRNEEEGEGETTGTSSSPTAATTTRTGDDLNNNNKNNKNSKSKKNSSATPFNCMFFGDYDDDNINTSGSNSEDDDEDDRWEDPLVGNVWGSAIGTNINRYSILGELDKKKKNNNNKKSKKKQQQQPKKKKKKKAPNRALQRRPGEEKPPIGYIKDFVKDISPQEGFRAALTFLVWGVGGGGGISNEDDEFDGVLIPPPSSSCLSIARPSSREEEYYYPETQDGIHNIFKRHSPLIQILGRKWPKFCSSLLVHLIDFVLRIEQQQEEVAVVVAATTLTTTEATTLPKSSSDIEKNAESSSSETRQRRRRRRRRKLYFASSWIRLLLSKQFMIKLDPELKKQDIIAVGSSSSSQSSNKNKDKKTKGKGGGGGGGIQQQFELAPLSYLSKYGYPLNSLCDHIIDESSSSSSLLSSFAQSNIHDKDNNLVELRTTSQSILTDLETILGEKRSPNYGVKGLDNIPSYIMPEDEQPQQQQQQQKEPVYGPILPPNKSEEEHDEHEEEDSEEEEEQGMIKKESGHKEEAPAKVTTAGASCDDGRKSDSLRDHRNQEAKTEKDVNMPNRASEEVQGDAAAQMSLDAMEALLSDDDGDDRHEVSSDKDDYVIKGEGTANNNYSAGEDGAATRVLEGHAHESPPKGRPAWVRCTTWDPCSIGTLPGRPV